MPLIARLKEKLRRGKPKNENRLQVGQMNEPHHSQDSFQNDGGESSEISTLEREGLFAFEDPEDAQSTKAYNIDIIAVHGLGGDWQKTWTADNGKLWLRDFLPAQLPRARVLSYGYNSATAFSKAVTDIEDVATILLDRLVGDRRLPGQKKRPVVFIAHSLGGIIVKKALIIAHEKSARFKDLLDSVRGCVFFAVPHRGSDVAYWGNFAANLLKFPLFGTNANTRFITSLQKNSGTFSDISQQFIERGASLRIRTFYETETYYKQLVVDKDSARLGLPNEIAVGVLGANHSDICKFSGAETQKYLHVGAGVAELVDSVDTSATSPVPFPVTSKEDETECLRSLYTSDYESHRGDIPSREPGTLEWFLAHGKFKHWEQEQNSSLLWVSADPGYGKSVLASFLVDELNSPESQLKLPSTVCYFFFKDGLEEQNNAESALCALLHQLFKANTSLVQHAMKEFKDKGTKFTQGFDTLWNIFREATTDPGCQNVICVIDALDECGELSRRKFLNSLVKIYQLVEDTGKTWLKFIVTSRPYGSIERGFGRLPSIRLKAENETTAISADVDFVIKARVKELGEDRKLPDDVQSNLQNRLLQGADRTFLWVSLILNILNDTLAASASEFDEIVRNLPSDLDDTYDRILRRSGDPKKVKTLLHIVVAAARPLTLEEIDIALAIRPGHKSIEDLKPHRMNQIATGVKDLCGLFVRVIDSKIYLVHQTAREFLENSSTTHHNTTRAWKHSLRPVESNLTLARICIRYLQFTVFETHPLNLVDYRQDGEEVDRYTRQHDFLDYAANHWAVHFQASQSTDEHELLHDVLELYRGSERLLTWFQVYWRFAELYNSFPGNLTDLMVASYLGHEAAVEPLLERGTDINSQGGGYGSALNIAVYRKYYRMAKMLLDKGAIVYLYDSAISNLQEKVRSFAVSPLNLTEVHVFCVLESGT